MKKTKTKKKQQQQLYNLLQTTSAIFNIPNGSFPFYNTQRNGFL
jgi:hypothetical protein